MALSFRVLGKGFGVWDFGVLGSRLRGLNMGLGFTTRTILRFYIGTWFKVLITANRVYVISKGFIRIA